MARMQGQPHSPHPPIVAQLSTRPRTDGSGGMVALNGALARARDNNSAAPRSVRAASDMLGNIVGERSARGTEAIKPITADSSAAYGTHAQS